jgi:hypothetical protein
MSIDDGYESHDVLRLNKSHYRRIQAAHAWFRQITAAHEKLGVEASKHDPCVYYTSSLIVLFCVGDYLLLLPDQLRSHWIHILHKQSKLRYCLI